MEVRRKKMGTFGPGGVGERGDPGKEVI